ncbi:tRNA1(Val) (adenine(37)-N6)-methyltransferase [Pendulispora albinea]|uniref:Methyltransferase n=1 Tax=Pendulispora albinea TaxID=2741071 RepID=A0ABZ2LLK9_9BACT
MEVGVGSLEPVRLARLLVHQPPRGQGYRVNVDAFHLAQFAAAPAMGRPAPRTVAFDLGAGSGAVGLALLALDAVQRVVFVELDPEAAAHAAQNIVEHGWRERAEVIAGDVSRICPEHAGAAHLVVCNPPYVEVGRGRVPAEGRRARARMGSLDAFVHAARTIAGRRARVCFVYPAREMATLFATLRAVGLEPKRLRAVHAKPDEPARIVLVESQPAKAGGLTIEPPLVECF